MISAENSGFSMLAPGKMVAGKAHVLSRELWILDAGFRQAGCQEGFHDLSRELWVLDAKKASPEALLAPESQLRI